KRVLRLREVLWVPGLTSNLVAVMQAMAGDVKMELVAGGMWVGREGDMSVWAPHLVERGGCVLTTEGGRGDSKSALRWCVWM
ncbi:unnamed protein product, partial [Tilletia caries]